MWPFGERRRNKRYPVDWQAALHCEFPEHRETIETRVQDVSLRGAKIHLERLQVGQYHLAIGDPAGLIELSLLHPGGVVKAPVEVRWYNWDEEKRVFSIAVEFTDISQESKSALEQMVRGL